MRLHHTTIMLVMLFSTVFVSLPGHGEPDVKQDGSIAEYHIASQPGDILLAAMVKDDIQPSVDVVTLIKDMQSQGDIPRQSATDLLEYPTELKYLLLGLGQGRPMVELLRARGEASVSDLQGYILAALLLYPVESYQLLEQLQNDEPFSSALILAVSKYAGLDQGRRFLSGSGKKDGIKIQPLFHSASVTLFAQQLDIGASIRFREAGAAKWQEGLALQWDPVRGTLSGSIVHLQADTRYQVEITRFKGAQQLDQALQYFTTRPNYPPVDPDKVYQLSDIYSGGQLDIQALKIQGSAQGWAKIVGDANTPIIAAEGDDAAIKIGDNSYILFENITVIGGRKNAISSYKAHHLWFNKCDVSGWGRAPNIVREGKFYEKEDDKAPINRDSAFALARTGVVVVENCSVHSPRAKASHWGNGHPMGPNAYLAWANHPEPEFQGQIVLRHNRFFGTDEHRFNDVIEGDANARMWGGFVRDSAIYNNYLAYANDDVVELDGGQSNVLFYFNEVEQGYCGVSAIPNQLGPSYIFNNYIHNLGDERGRAWAGIKLGGLFALPAGRTLIFENLLVNNGANGIAGASFEGDRTYWALVKNNILLNESAWDNKGYGVIDKNAFGYFDNNLIYNIQLSEARLKARINIPYKYASQLEDDYGQKILHNKQAYYSLPVGSDHIDNFSQLSAPGRSMVGIVKQGSVLP